MREKIRTEEDNKGEGKEEECNLEADQEERRE